MANREDKQFIFPVWRKQLYLSHRDTYRYMDHETYKAHIDDMLETLFNCNLTKVIVPEEHEFQVLGFICCNPKKNNIIFVYVKTIYRENGLMKKMLNHCFGEEKIKYYSGLTTNKWFKSFIEKHELEYMPVEFVL